MDQNDIELRLTAKECCAILRISPATFYRRVADRTIPKPIKIGGIAARWPRSEILAVIEAAKDARG